MIRPYIELVIKKTTNGLQALVSWLKNHKFQKSRMNLSFHTQDTYYRVQDLRR